MMGPSRMECGWNEMLFFWECFVHYHPTETGYIKLLYIKMESVHLTVHWQYGEFDRFCGILIVIFMPCMAVSKSFQIF